MKKEIEIALITILVFVLVLVFSLQYVSEEREEALYESTITYETYIHSKDLWKPAINTHKIARPKTQKETGVSYVPILMFHNVAPIPPNASELKKSLTVDPKLFESMMEYLKKNGFTPITLKELNKIWAGKMPMPLKPIVLTFDDGDKGVYEYAYPILKKYNFHFVIFLITKYTGMHTHFYMSKTEVKEMHDSGLCEIGTHTRDHVNLKKTPLITKIYEIKTCTNDVKRLFNYTPTSFCYPFGGFDRESVELLKANGYTMATTVIPGVANSKDNPLLLPRIRIDGRENLKAFIMKVNLKP
ncbi:polysaccharide deacetylase family protein [Caldisericum exile]|uniref:Hydrolase n=1 Tax=Caldisericum exile (strain DSM 21853 / NBRC 104410 / AZM16c01) TaxID=511051 RepID=A0A7U6GDC6_CALEA|nr:polysaccharide deacetylase family protein [Caldisericum exile]BAL80266.1 putative hydrolase [Caldisericum exile AZM16c01]